LPGEVINKVRQEGLRKLFLYKLSHYPLQTYRLLRRFLRFMPAWDVIYLIIKPFVGQRKGATKAEVLSRAVEHAEMKDEAAQLTRLTQTTGFTRCSKHRALSVGGFNRKQILASSPWFRPDERWSNSKCYIAASRVRIRSAQVHGAPSSSCLQ